MRAIGQRVGGSILAQGRDRALLLRTLQPQREDPDTLILRFPFLTRGPGDPIFPAIVVDDWGREMRTAALYAWVRENGDRFPRSEIFGFEADGRETQVFLREMELLGRLPCYAYASPQMAVNEGVQIHAILLPDEAVTEPTLTTGPDGLKLPLRLARVSWWRVPAGAGPDLELSRLLDQARRGA